MSMRISLDDDASDPVLWFDAKVEPSWGILAGSQRPQMSIQFEFTMEKPAILCTTIGELCHYHDFFQHWRNSPSLF
jgi:hypothetical protein